MAAHGVLTRQVAVGKLPDLVAFDLNGDAEVVDRPDAGVVDVQAHD
jgi:hypothetical protein